MVHILTTKIHSSKEAASTTISLPGQELMLLSRITREKERAISVKEVIYRKWTSANITPRLIIMTFWTAVTTKHLLTKIDKEDNTPKFPGIHTPTREWCHHTQYSPSTAIWSQESNKTKASWTHPVTTKEVAEDQDSMLQAKCNQGSQMSSQNLSKTWSSNRLISSKTSNLHLVSSTPRTKCQTSTLSQPFPQDRKLTNQCAWSVQGTPSHRQEEEDPE